jgi:hypothetical protein
MSAEYSVHKPEHRLLSPDGSQFVKSRIHSGTGVIIFQTSLEGELLFQEPEVEPPTLHGPEAEH